MVTTRLMKNFGPSKTSCFPRVFHAEKKEIEYIRFPGTVAHWILIEEMEKIGAKYVQINISEYYVSHMLFQ